MSPTTLLDRDTLKNLSEINSLRQVGYFFGNWFFIVSLSVVCHAYSHWALYIPTVLLIACRQHALLVLAHDAAHYRISKNKNLNDFISNFFSSFPCLMGTQAYRTHHLAHHQYLNTDKDPDWARKVHLPEWQFPMSQAKFSKVMARQFLVGGYQWAQLTLMMFLKGLNLENSNPHKKESRLLGIYFVGVIALSLYFGIGAQVLMYWFVPLFTVFPAIQRLRSISEHFGVNEDMILNMTRNTDAGAVERFLLAPHGVNWHLIHHIYPSIPHYNLDQTQKILMQIPEYTKGQHLNFSYLLNSKRSVLQDITKDEENNQMVTAA